jgi:hypothetical protein
VYKDFLHKINNETKKLYETILAEYNFEFGYEFEIALCKLLRLILPQKYSICRGYIVSANDQTAGDDIIIYDANLFPKIRLIEDDLSIKQYIPAEAVYAYIEAKHTLYLDNESGQSLKKACSQVGLAKNIPREKRLLTELDYGNIADGGILKVTAAPNWPTYRNPMYGCIIARNVSLKNGTTVSMKDFHKHISEGYANSYPDLIIAGEKFIFLPATQQPDTKHTIDSPFFIPNVSVLIGFETEMNMGVGIINLLRALNYIILKPINY